MRWWYVAVAWLVLLAAAWLAAVWIRAWIRADWNATQLIWDGTYEGLYD